MTRLNKKFYEEDEEQQQYIKDDPIINTIGQLGRYQVVTSILMMMANFAIAWHHLIIIFMAPYGQNNNTCKNPGANMCSDDCKEIEYDRSIFEETIITQWGLVCQNDYLANLSQMLFMLGALVGNVGFGSLSDRYGRRIPLLVCSIMTVLFGVSVAYAPQFWLFCFLRFFVGVATGGLTVICFVQIMEIVGPKWRETFSVIFQLPFNLGHLSLAGISYFLRDWRDLQVTISLLSLAKILYFFLISESPVWLFSTGRLRKAEEVLKYAAKRNNLPSEGIEKRLQEAYQKKLDKTEGDRGNVLDLFRYPNMRLKTFCILFNSFSCGLTFFGLAQYIGNITGNIFLNVAVSAIMCIPGSIITIFLCKFLGRRNTLFIANVITGASLLIIAGLGEDQETLIVIFASLGIFGISLAFPTVFLYSAELFPTVIRNVGVGLSSMTSRIGSMLAPFIAGLSATQPMVPPIVFGTIPIAAAILCYFLPETKGKELPDTMKEGEEFGKKDKQLKSFGYT